MRKFITTVTLIVLLTGTILPVNFTYAEEFSATRTGNLASLAAAQTTTDSTEPTSEQAAAPTYVPGEVIVVFKTARAFKQAEEITAKAIDSVADCPDTNTTSENSDTSLLSGESEDSFQSESSGAPEDDNIDINILSQDEKAVLVTGAEECDELALCEELEQEQGVAFAQPNYYYQTETNKSKSKRKKSLRDPLIKRQWNLKYIDGKAAWSLIAKLEKKKNWNKSEHPRVKIAVLDTGVNTKHRDLADISKGGNIDYEHSVSVQATERNYNDEVEYEIATYTNTAGGHGTSTASIIGATYRNGVGVAGVASGKKNNIVEVMAIDVFPTYDKSMVGPAQRYATTADVVAGIDYAVNNGARVILMCLGHTINSADGTGRLHDNQWLHRKIQWAVNDNDILIACSAGNGASSIAWYPSDFEEVVSCISTQNYTNVYDAENCRNNTSNYGPNKNISAPGAGILVADSGTNQYKTTGGTSAAAATVAAVAAMVRYVNPSLSQQEVKDILYKTTNDLGDIGYDEMTGWGNVNAYNAVSAAAGLNKRLSAKKLRKPVVRAKAVKYSANTDATSAIRLTWKRVSHANKYYIYRSDKAKSGYTMIGETGAVNRQYVDKGLTPHKKYYYKVKAIGTSGTGKRAESLLSRAAFAKAPKA